MKLFGKKAVAAMFKELKQFNDGVVPGKPVIEPIPFEHLKDEDKTKALEAVILIAQKRCGKIKGRTCANGARQRRFISDNDSFVSPTASSRDLRNKQEGSKVEVFVRKGFKGTLWMLGVCTSVV